ncbi:MAG: 50S ribosome-binding GTPase [Komarekiella atlantica HA4396-MV6]|nr:50S ribosome-binding GTPase [Komarekiella atlantica HA4396-MV6]
MTEQRDPDSPSDNSQQFSESNDSRIKSSQPRAGVPSVEQTGAEKLPTALSPDTVTTKSGNDSWTNRITGVWNKATERLTQLLPVEQLAQTAVNWFSVSEAQVAEILEKVRAELPTTEAILIGKPQAGKSSIVRGLTGVSAEIVGQGFRPHTQNTQRYAYPSNDLPLLIFTDTVGLGDVNQNTQAIIQELIGDLKQESRRARVLILTVKINDFATDTLREIAQQLRQQYPDIPCLLVVTCLHEVYPPGTLDHPAYPPDYQEVNRAFAAMQQTFAKVCVGVGEASRREASPKGIRFVMIDFTLEEDGYTPVFYGLEALRDALAELLPEAEAKAIYQLLDQEEVGEQIGNLYRDAGRRYILPFAIMSATLAAVPLPFATMPVLTALQVSMVGLLGKLYGQTLTPSQAGGIVSAIAGGFLAQAIARELIKFVPGFGSAIAASWAAAYTWSLGEAACVYFGDLMGGKKPDPQKIQSVMQEAFKIAQKRFNSKQ